MLPLQRSSSEYQRITDFKRYKIEIKIDKEKDDLPAEELFS